ncbi:DUF4192 domain-containing protein [Kitasatospora sp. NPDC096147]|uniref:DUF4192 domain-containing protein n=1 Tax=Kitasatospora sp. NPDC096147 TaxID=3364093 RepID=UPI0038042EC0
MIVHALPVFDVSNPAEAVEALPFMIGLQPERSIVAFVFNQRINQPVGVVRISPPADPQDWPEAGDDLMHKVQLVLAQASSEADSILLYICPKGADFRSGKTTVAHFAPLAAVLSAAARTKGLAVLGTYFATGTHWWDLQHPGQHPEGIPAHGPHNPGPVTTEAVVAGIPMPPSMAEIIARFEPGADAGPADDEAAVAAAHRWVDRIRAEGPHAEDARFGDLLDRLLLDGGDGSPLTDLTPEVIADLLTGMQIRHLRDIGAQFVEPSEVRRAHELWCLLARRSADRDLRQAAAPLALAGFTAWLVGEMPAAAIAIEMACMADPSNRLAHLLAGALEAGTDVEVLADRMRALRKARLERRQG